MTFVREKADFDIDRILEIEQQTRHVWWPSRAVSEAAVKSASGFTMG